jgi:hypothetical protein
VLDVKEIEVLFRQYWKESFPMAPAGKQAAMTHVAFAEYVIRSIESNQAKQP